MFYLCCQWAMQFSFHQNDYNTQKEEICLMHNHTKTLIKSICIHKIMYKCQYKSATSKKSPLCSRSAIHVQQMNNNIKIKGYKTGWMLVRIYDCECGLCIVQYAPFMPTCQSYILIQYCRALCKGRLDPSKETSLILHHSLMGHLLNSADNVFFVFTFHVLGRT